MCFEEVFIHVWWWGLFGSSSSSALAGCDEELDEVFGETKENNPEKGKIIEEYFLIGCLFPFIANAFSVMVSDNEYDEQW